MLCLSHFSLILRKGFFVLPCNFVDCLGCQTFQEFFDRHPEVLSHFDKFDAIEIDAVRVSDALRMHASRVLAIVEDIVDNTGNPDKIRKLMQDLGRNHYKQVE